MMQNSETMEEGEIIDDIFENISSEEDEIVKGIKHQLAYFEAQNKEIEMIEHISQSKLTHIEILVDSIPHFNLCKIC